MEGKSKGDHTSTIFKSCFEKALDDKIFLLKKESGIISLSKALSVAPETTLENFHQIIHHIVDMIPSGVSANTMETFIRNFNETIMTTSMEKWCAMITLSGVEHNSKDSLILHHFVVTDILKHILKFRNNFLDEPIDKLTDEDLKLDDHEENTIRYVAGHIPSFSLLKSQED